MLSRDEHLQVRPVQLGVSALAAGKPGLHLDDTEDERDHAALEQGGVAAQFVPEGGGQDGGEHFACVARPEMDPHCRDLEGRGRWRAKSHG